MLKKAWFATAFLATCTSVNAKPYIGASVGQAMFNNSTISTSGSSYNLELEDDESLVGKVFGGYQFNQYFALEGAIGGYDALDGSIVTVGDMRFIAIQPKAILPLSDRLSIFAKAGLSYFSAEFTLLSSIGYTTVSDEAVTGMYGLGAEFAVADNVRLHVEWDYMKPELDVLKVANMKATIDAEINVLSVGMSYHF
ncbi:outer membrane beta-barrel protein [Vibrio rotiferianus]|uniref:outer membrane beta-barrel protein n=1 Tax=Vibrio rotiferianus TaxID=190895 RepID=UPI003980BA01